MATKHLQFKVDEVLKNEAEEVLQVLWLDIPTLMRMCLRQVSIQKSVPFQITQHSQEFTPEKKAELLQVYHDSFNPDNTAWRASNKEELSSLLDNWEG